MQEKKHWQYQSVIDSKRKYEKKNVVQVALKLNVNTDKDILDKLDSVDNKQGYIKTLIRKDLEEAQ